MHLEKTLLRVVTAGSVDDGKSTLMGRLLSETKSIFDDQFDAIRRTSTRRGLPDVDLSLLLDGLAAEREQGITIDVAYRYFETAHRKVILADCPGHEQYTRNMVTGASTAECGIVLVNAANGVVSQSRRHAFILSLLQVPHVLVVVNKMDTVAFDEGCFADIVDDYQRYGRRLEARSVAFMPACALHGDNVTMRSERMPWYEGPTLLQYLESIHVASDRNLIDFRFPIQHVIRHSGELRRFAGRIASGTIRVGEQVAVLPSGRTTHIRSIETYDGSLQEAFSPQSVAVTLTDEVDVGRGSMLVRPANLPEVGNHLEATLCWMDDAPLKVGVPYILKHTTQTVKAVVSKLIYRFDIDTLHRQDAVELRLNEIGRTEIQTTRPLFFDPYKLNHSTGAFILIDASSNRTVAAGMIRGRVSHLEDVGNTGGERTRPRHVVPHEPNIPRDAREARNGHKAAVLWLTGLSGAGKSTIGRGLETALAGIGCHTMLLDGDQLRGGLCGDLRFTTVDRAENIRRAGEVAKLFFDAGHVVICTFISPSARDRAFARSLILEGRFVEIYVACPLETCIKRDPNGLYRKALKGEIADFTGISAEYEPPTAAEIVVHTDQTGVEFILQELIAYLRRHGIVRPETR